MYIDTYFTMLCYCYNNGLHGFYIAELTFSEAPCKFET